MFFEKEEPKKDNSPKCKVNTLAHYVSFGPKCLVIDLSTLDVQFPKHRRLGSCP
jgi:hypothetical protein